MTDNTAGSRPSLARLEVVRELFASAADEVLWRLHEVSARRLPGDRARLMDEALAKHLARALMGENPNFAPAPGFSGLTCARSLAQVDAALMAGLFENAPADDNPRVLMVRAVTVFFHAVYREIAREMKRDDVTEDSVRQALARLAGRWALAAVPPAGAGS